MKLAVVIPSYNHARYIGGALESVLAQSRKPDRIIVIDDGSRDNSVEVLEGFRARGVEVLARENRGAHNTINQAIDLAAQTCDVISILNSDDAYLPGRFETCLALLKSHPDKSVVCTGLEVMDETDGLLDASHPRAKWFNAIWSWRDKPDLDLCEWLGMCNFPATTTNIIARASWLQRFPFRPYRFIHDYYFLAQTVLRDQMLLVAEPLLRYRVHGSNTMNVSPAPLLREMLQMHLDLFHDIAAELRTDAEMRARFYRYSRSLWNSASAFHGGLFQVLFATLAAEKSSEDILALTSALDETAWPELNSYPNRAVMNAHDGVSFLGTASALADKYEAARAEARQRKESERDWKELANFRREALRSRWAALGRFLGLAPDLADAPGTDASVKLATLRERARRSAWLKLGQAMGSKALKNFARDGEARLP